MKIDYACLSRVFQEGGVVVTLVARNSLFPPNCEFIGRQNDSPFLTLILIPLPSKIPIDATAVFATCGMRFWVVAVAVLASLSPRFVMVYLGALSESEFDVIRAFLLFSLSIISTQLF